LHFHVLMIFPLFDFVSFRSSYLSIFQPKLNVDGSSEIPFGAPQSSLEFCD